jgi:hypothetical protein
MAEFEVKEDDSELEHDAVQVEETMEEEQEMAHWGIGFPFVSFHPVFAW